MDKMSGAGAPLGSPSPRSQEAPLGSPCTFTANGTKKEIFSYDLTEEEKAMPNRIADMFTGRTIFITGATGFLGKTMLEKILRVSPGIKRIYILVRTKKGKEVKQRTDELFSSPLFDHLKMEHGDHFASTKVFGISGDVSLPDLGISPADRQTLIDEVSIVYHAAATIRFDESLKKAVLLNTRGTKLMMELSKEMKNLDIFCHISTAYCHLRERVLYERPYEPPADPHKIIKCVEWMEDAVVESMTEQILGDLPNTYAFTKALSEGLVNEQMDKMPVVIMRPSIVIPIWKDPLPGWTDNINGPTGLLIAAGKGVLRTMYCKQEGYADFLPVDVAVNGILIGTWNYVENKAKEKQVYHLTSSSEFQVSWADIIDIGRVVAKRVPLNGIAWYPGGTMKKSRLLHQICVLFFHLIPAIFLDCIIFLAGHKPVLMRVHRRIIKGFEIFEYYANNQWDFKNENVVMLRQIMNKKERKVFKIDGDGLDLEAYFEDCVYAARAYILNESLDTLPAARKHLKIMYWVDVIAHALFFFFFFWMLYSYSGTAVDMFSWAKRMVVPSTVEINHEAL